MIRDWLLLPGWGFSRAVFAQVERALPETLRVFAPSTDRGRRAPVGGLRCARIEHLRVSAGTRPLGLCGWSLGAMLAIDWAARFPDEIGALVLVGATPRFIATGDWPCAMPQTAFDTFAALATRSPRRAQVRLATLSAQGETDPPSAFRALCNALLESDAAAAHDASLRDDLEFLRHTDLRDRLASVVAPTTLIHGSEDALVPMDAARRLATALPDARLIEAVQTGHAPFLPRPGLLVDVITARARH